MLHYLVSNSYIYYLIICLSWYLRNYIMFVKHSTSHVSTFLMRCKGNIMKHHPNFLDVYVYTSDTLFHSNIIRLHFACENRYKLFCFVVVVVVVVVLCWGGGGGGGNICANTIRTKDRLHRSCFVMLCGLIPSHVFHILQFYFVWLPQCQGSNHEEYWWIKNTTIIDVISHITIVFSNTTICRK